MIVYQLLSHGRWFSPGTPASSTTKTGRHDIAQILLKVALNTIKSNQEMLYFREMLIDIMFDDLESGTISRDEFIIRMKKYSSIEEDNDETLHQVR